MNDSHLPPESEQRLDAQFDLLRRGLEPLNTPDAVSARLMAAYAKQHRKSGWRMLMAQWLAPGLGLAASVGMAAWITLAPVTPSVADMPLAKAGSAEEDASPFIALQSLERIAREPSPHLVETTVPRMMLASMGVPVNPEVAGDSIRAQMLVAANGQPLAMRLTQ